MRETCLADGAFTYDDQLRLEQPDRCVGEREEIFLYGAGATGDDFRWGLDDFV